MEHFIKQVIIILLPVSQTMFSSMFYYLFKNNASSTCKCVTKPKTKNNWIHVSPIWLNFAQNQNAVTKVRKK